MTPATYPVCEIFLSDNNHGEDAYGILEPDGNTIDIYGMHNIRINNGGLTNPNMFGTEVNMNVINIVFVIHKETEMQAVT